MPVRVWTTRPAPALRLPVADALRGRSARGAWDVGALLLAVGDALQARFGAVAVRGELSGLARAGSGHWYFTLKDIAERPSLLRCAMFRRHASLVDFEPGDGQQVEVRGRLAVYDARGDLQLIVESMQPLGAGALYEQFLRLKARLEAEGLFDAVRKRPIEPWPRTIGIVTSTAAAALRDVLARAAARREVDTLLLVRGGGSLEDLWAFNDERLVRAIVASPIPVICGVGHESDVTLADLAADLRAATPTAAAELAAPAQAEALARLDAIALLQQRVLLGTVERRLGVALRFRVGQGAHDLVHLASRLATAGRSQLDLRRQRCVALGARLDALDPQRVLARGFVWIEDAGGRPVLRAADVHAGARLGARWADGQAQVEVLKVRLDDDLDRPR